MGTAKETKAAAVTGAAGGLGASFARKLAERGYDLWLIDRREEQIGQLGDELMTKHGVAARVLITDLTDDDAVKSLGQELADTSSLELLVNNAGFGLLDYVIDADVERQLDMIRVHVMASVRLTCAVLPGMTERNQGAVINLSSLSAWTPCAGVVSYSSTKAYLTVFSQGLQDELRDTNVRIQALCPGFVHTEFHDTEGMRSFDLGQVPGWLWMMPDEVVEYSLKSLSRKRVIVIPGWRARILGRFMQMPVLQPLVRALARQERVKDS
jgi:short-subunit dehydrogenase